MAIFAPTKSRPSANEKYGGNAQLFLDTNGKPQFQIAMDERVAVRIAMQNPEPNSPDMDDVTEKFEPGRDDRGWAEEPARDSIHPACGKPDHLRSIASFSPQSGSSFLDDATASGDFPPSAIPANDLVDET